MAGSWARTATAKPAPVELTVAVAPFGTSGQSGMFGASCPSAALRARWQSTMRWSHSAVMPGTARKVTTAPMVTGVPPLGPDGSVSAATLAMSAARSKGLVSRSASASPTHALASAARRASEAARCSAAICWSFAAIARCASVGLTTSVQHPTWYGTPRPGGLQRSSRVAASGLYCVA